MAHHAFDHIRLPDFCPDHIHAETGGNVVDEHRGRKIGGDGASPARKQVLQGENERHFFGNFLPGWPHGGEAVRIGIKGESCPQARRSAQKLSKIGQVLGTRFGIVHKIAVEFVMHPHPLDAKGIEQGGKDRTCRTVDGIDRDANA